MSGRNSDRDFGFDPRERRRREKHVEVSYTDQEKKEFAISNLASFKKAVDTFLSASPTKKTWVKYGYEFMNVVGLVSYISGKNKFVTTADVGKLPGWKPRVGRKIAALKLLRQSPGGDKLKNITKLIEALEALHKAL